MKIRRLVNAQVLVALIALAVMAGCLVWWPLSDDTVVKLNAPTYRGQPVEHVMASVPRIGDFDKEFNVNDENPFIPFFLRKAESVAIKNPRSVTPPKVGQPEIEIVPLPPLILPVVASRRHDAPECIGIIRSQQDEVLLVRMPGAREKETQRLHVGEKIAETVDAKHLWTLISLEDGNLARFRDPAGMELVFSIGSMAVLEPVSKSRSGPENNAASNQPGTNTPNPNSSALPVPSTGQSANVRKPRIAQQPASHEHGQGNKPQEMPTLHSPRPPPEPMTNTPPPLPLSPTH